MARRINRELVALGAEENPRRFVSQLESHVPPYFSLHVGDFRVVMRMYDDRRVMIVVDPGPRTTIYREVLTGGPRETGTDHEKRLIAVQIEQADRAIDTLVYDRYGLTPEECAIVEGWA